MKLPIANNILNLVLSNFPEKFSKIEKCVADFFMDHNILSFSIKYSVQRQPSARRYIYNYKHADFTFIQKQLSEANLDESENINSAWQIWLSRVQYIIVKNVPEVYIMSRDYPEWLDREVVIHLTKQRTTALRRAC